MLGLERWREEDACDFEESKKGLKLKRLREGGIVNLRNKQQAHPCSAWMIAWRCGVRASQHRLPLCRLQIPKPVCHSG